MKLGRPTLPWAILVPGLVATSFLATSQGVQLDGLGFERGSPQAPVRVIEFGDFGCSACAQFAEEVLPTVQQEFVGSGRVHWTFVPFILGAFRNSRQATAAALCSADQGAFWPMHDRLYQAQRRWSAARDPGPVLTGLAAEFGLDSLRFQGCYRDRNTAKQVGQLTKLAKRFSINATPTFLVSGRRIRGALPLALFRQVLLEAGAP